MLALFPAIGIPLCQDPYVEEYLGHATPGRWSGTARQDDCVPALLCFYHNSVMSAVSVAGEFPSAYTIVAAAVPRVRGKRWTASRPRELLASVSPVEAEQPEEVGGIDEDLPSVTEASLAVEITASGCGLGKVACGDVMPDLVPFGRRQYAP
jgi:hypothetical protein